MFLPLEWVGIFSFKKTLKPKSEASKVMPESAHLVLGWARSVSVRNAAKREREKKATSPFFSRPFSLAHTPSLSLSPPLDGCNGTICLPLSVLCGCLRWHSTYEYTCTHQNLASKRFLVIDTKCLLAADSPMYAPREALVVFRFTRPVGVPAHATTFFRCSAEASTPTLKLQPFLFFFSGLIRQNRAPKNNRRC